MVICVSCGRTHITKGSSIETKETVEVIANAPIDSLLVCSGDSVMLSEQALTSPDAIERAFPDDTAYFYAESTHPERTFYIPDSDIKDRELTKIVQSRYNYAAVLNRVIHSYQWFHRMTTGAYDDEYPTKKDTLEWIKHSRPMLARSFIGYSIPNNTALGKALQLLVLYDHFDGDDREGSMFNWAYQSCLDTYTHLPAFATKELFSEYDKTFWKWYDKEQFFPGIDQIVKMNMKDYRGDEITESQLLQFRKAILCEKNIDRRTILALEYAKFEPFDGAVLLGDIIESGIYSRYLLETWISWRANVQANHSPSSFSTIPNNYYDMLRVKCIDTILRHCLKEGDPMALCMLEELITTHILTRMACISGNESMLTRMHLANDLFIPDRLKHK